MRGNWDWLELKAQTKGEAHACRDTGLTVQCELFIIRHCRVSLGSRRVTAG